MASKAVEEAKATAAKIKATDTEPEDEGNEDEETTEDDSDTVAIQTGFGEVRVPKSDLDHTPSDA